MVSKNRKKQLKYSIVVRYIRQNIKTKLSEIKKYIYIISIEPALKMAADVDNLANHQVAHIKKKTIVEDAAYNLV